MNEHFLLTVTKAARDDLVEVREKFGSDSLEYQKQIDISTGFIRGSLEAVLTAAIPHLEDCLRREKPSHTI